MTCATCRAGRRRWSPPLLLALAACTLSPGGSFPGGGAPAPDAGSPPAGPPPFTAAHPAGGLSGAVQYVTLASDRLATVYYTVDGTEPVLGSPGTSSGANPVFWIRVGPGTTVLKFFAVDADGNREVTRAETYVVGLPPAVAFAAPTPASLALLDRVFVGWQSDRSGTYVVELGGDGTPGSGTWLASGSVAANAPMSQEVSALAHPSGGWPALLSVHVTDASGRRGSASTLLDLVRAAVIGPTGCEAVAVLPDGRRAYVTGDDTDRGLTVVDTDPLSGSYGTVLAHLGVAGSSSLQQLAVTPDGQRVYASDPYSARLYAIAAATGQTIAALPLSTPGALAVAPDGKRAYVGVRGGLAIVDVDPDSAAYHTIVGNVPLPLPLLSIAIASDGKRAAASLQLGGSTPVRELDVIDLDPLSPTRDQVVATPLPGDRGQGGPVVISPDGRFAYASDRSADCGLCKIDLATNVVVGKASALPPSNWMLAVTPDGGKLLVPFTQDLEVYDASDLRWEGSAPVDVPGLRTIDAFAIAPDGTTAYATDSPDSWGACQLVAIPLHPR